MSKKTKALCETVRDALSSGNVKAVRREKGLARHYLMWVGSKHYPMIEHFMLEASTRGVSKRLNMVTPHLVPGQTRVYLAHSRLFETASRFLDCESETAGIKHPKISKIKSLRKIGEEIVQGGHKIKDLKSQLVKRRGLAWDLWNGRFLKCRQPSGKMKRKKIGYSNDIYRALCGSGQDHTFRALVDERMKRTSPGRPLKYNYRGRPTTISTGLVAAALDVCAEFVQEIDEGKAIFGWFQLECLEYILPRGKGLPSYLRRQGYRGRQILDLISQSDGGYRDDDLPKICRVVQSDEEAQTFEPRGSRGCGYRKEDGVYAVSYMPRSGLELHGPINFSNTNVKATGIDYYRGLRSIPDELADRLEKAMKKGD